VAKSQTIGASEIHAAIERLATAISNRYANHPRLLLLGIANGGVELARRLAATIGSGADRTVYAGVVDISFHRDDIERHPVPKEFAPTHIPADVHGASIILVDDVLFSGRTVKAALDEVFDHGRPTKVELAVLVDRGGRRLPIAADYVGLNVAATEHQKVAVALDPKDRRRDAIRIEPISPAKHHSPV
jgi:pyrimidine operon attenuation protein/uracil phosphoribosyltransferase